MTSTVFAQQFENRPIGKFTSWYRLSVSDVCEDERGQMAIGVFVLGSWLVSLFWAAYYECTGTIPHLDHVPILWWTWHLPFQMSRLYDALLGPLFLLLFLGLVTSDFFAVPENAEMKLFGSDYWILEILVTMSLVGGFVIGCLFGFPAGLVGIPVSFLAICVVVAVAMIVSSGIYWATVKT